MNTERRHIFYAVLNMGLGHATRSLPVIQALLQQGYRVTVGSSGRALIFLRQELPEAHFLELPDYNLTYSEKGAQPAALLLRLPALMKKIRKEHHVLQQYQRRFPLHGVISDHRYGCYLPGLPSYLLIHQLRFIAPAPFRRLERVGVAFNRFFGKRYGAVLVPDERNSPQSGGILTGRLTRVKESIPIYFTGILSSLPVETTAGAPIDVLISISGPEPQRTILEKIVRRQLGEIPGRKVVLLGKPEETSPEHLPDGTVIYPHLSRHRMGELFNRSQLIVSRSGYSTVMELAELGKRALFIPTPGQTEQEYLAWRYRKHGWFHAASQFGLKLGEEIARARQLPGFPRRFSTRQSVQRILSLLEKEFE